MDPKRPVVDVLAAVVRSGDRLLLGRRPPGKRHGGLWEFPGGKVGDGESWPVAAERELDEELGVHLRRLGAVLYRRRDPGAPYLVHFVEAEIDGEPEALEHEELRWVRPEDLWTLALAPADAAFASWLSAPGCAS